MSTRRSMSMRWNRVGFADPVSIAVVGGMVVIMGGMMIGMGWMMSRMMKHGGQRGGHGAAGHGSATDSSQSGADMGGMGMMGMGHTMGMGQGSKDSMGMHQMCPMMGQKPVVGVGAGELPEPESAGAKLYGHYCSQCHALPSPQGHSSAEWDDAFARMHEKMWMAEGMGQGGMMGMMGMGHMMGGMGDKISAPTTDEGKTILDYLKRHALASVSPEALSDGLAEGRQAFLEVCVRCHALPDPAQHARAEWPAVIDRMHQNMTAMKVEAPAPETWEKAGEYLLSVAPPVSAPARPPAHRHEGGVPPCCGAP